MSMVGADTERLAAAAVTMRRAADDLDLHSKSINQTIGGLTWIGQVASTFVNMWNGGQRAQLHSTAHFIRDAAAKLDAQAQQQRDASAGMAGAYRSEVRVVSPTAAAARAEIKISGLLDTGGWGVTGDDLRQIRSTLAGLSPGERSTVLLALSDEEMRVLYDQMREGTAKGGLSEGEMAAFYTAVTPGLSSEALARLMGADAPTVGHSFEFGNHHSTGQAVSSAMGATGPGGPGEGEIEIRRLDSGKYVVVLPGVTDLSNSLSTNPLNLRHLDGENTSDTPRDMHYASQAAMGDWRGSITNKNAYALAVKIAMQTAGVPAGADVMVVGHSFGAYTAMQLAADPTFNSAAGGDAYHVNITNVVAAGADTDWMHDHVVNGTQAISLLNTNDQVAMGEAGAFNLNPQGANVEEVVFRGGGEGHGHAVSNYVAAIDKQLGTMPEFLERVDSGYSSGGTAMRVRIHDAYRQQE